MAEFILSSEQHHTNASLQNLFEFLSDFKNFDAILPHDKITDFKATENNCSFAIKGITALSIRITEKHPYEFILFSTEGLASFNFNLKVFFIGDPSIPGDCKIDLFGNMNPFIRSMAEKPLLALINTMSLKLSQLSPNT